MSNPTLGNSSIQITLTPQPRPEVGEAVGELVQPYLAVGAAPEEFLDVGVGDIPHPGGGFVAFGVEGVSASEDSCAESFDGRSGPVHPCGERPRHPFTVTDQVNPLRVREALAEQPQHPREAVVGFDVVVRVVERVERPAFRFMACGAVGGMTERLDDGRGTAAPGAEDESVYAVMV